MDIELDINFFNILHYCYEICIFVCFVYYMNYENITFSNNNKFNLLWFVLLVCYIDWLIWNNLKQSILFILILTGYIIILYLRNKKHNKITELFKNKWNNINAMIYME